MNVNQENPEVQEEIIPLGTASVETKGPLSREEFVGGTIVAGLSAE